MRTLTNSQHIGTKSEIGLALAMIALAIVSVGMDINSIFESKLFPMRDLKIDQARDCSADSGPITNSLQQICTGKTQKEDLDRKKRDLN